MKIADEIYHIGISNNNLELFESQYALQNGMSYNSYVIKDEKNVILDTIDEGVTNEWEDKLQEILGAEEVDYLIVSHMEPDHAYNIGKLAEKYPNMKIVGNQFTFNILTNFFKIINLEERKIVVKEGDTLDIGKHKLQFFMAPMVHWPEVMITYELTEKMLFTADAFGKFGSLDIEDDWVTEARRYYFGIVGKYGAQVQALLNKLGGVEVNTICPLHGPVLKENLAYYLDKYKTWSAYLPEEEGVYIACASIYGNSLRAAREMEKRLKDKGVNVVLDDLTTTEWSEAVANAFRYSRVLLVASSYNAGVFPPMRRLLDNLKERNYQNRKVGIMENGSWAPSAGKTMRDKLAEMKDIEVLEPMVTIKSVLKDENMGDMEKLAEQLAKWSLNILLHLMLQKCKN